MLQVYRVQITTLLLTYYYCIKSLLFKLAWKLLTLYEP